MSDIALTVTEQVVSLTETGGTTVEIAITETPVALTVAAGVTDHGQLEGLGDDDHPQYLLRDDYVPGGDADTLQGHEASYFEVAGAASSAVAAHVAAANPHSQYLLIADYTPGGTPGGSSGQVQYNNGSGFAGHSGFTYNGAGIITVGSALIAPVWKPSVDLTTALKITKADGTTAVVTVDTVTPSVTVAGSITIPNNKYYRATKAGGSTINLLGLDTNDTLVFSGMNQVQFSNVNLALTNAATPALIFSATGGSMRISANSGVMTVANSTNSPLFTVANNSVSVVPALILAASSASNASVRIPSDTAPTSPNSGDLWYDGTNLKFRDGSTTRTLTWT